MKRGLYINPIESSKTVYMWKITEWTEWTVQLLLPEETGMDRCVRADQIKYDMIMLLSSITTCFQASLGNMKTISSWEY